MAAGAVSKASAVVFFVGDRVSPPASALVTRLQQPAELHRILAAKFPGARIAVVQPQRYDGEFACFDNWLAAAPLRQGVPPRFDADGYPAAAQLASVLGQAALQGLAATAGAVASPAPQQPAQHQRPLPAATLVGFSKSVIVLHQLLVELAAWQQAAGQDCAVCSWQMRRQQQQRHGAVASRSPLPHDLQQQLPPPAAEAALAAVRELHWLDGGANSRGAAHATEPPLFQALAQRCSEHAVRVVLHGTPRQWHDPQRRWLGREAAAMAAAATAAGLACERREYFAGQPRSMEQHFAVIDAFECR